MRFTRTLQQTLLRAGIDVILQEKFQNAVIKPQSLSRLILESTAPFLAVVGDRNVRNETVSARLNETLVEITPCQFVTVINARWRDALVEQCGCLSDADLVEMSEMELCRTAQKIHPQGMFYICFQIRPNQTLPS
ncbi:hypothetical protein KIPB_002328 [Kipferlia bialata]|uniref:Uncharacterized protein n=1 Tax=Kipferlia bialata TaxID=797122 RepID=A0A9K3CQ10_9EUKA|nr:hypothetical protein KIPB_002328 [Kipferlia bialata]|eukprot:g2328.t1